MEIIARQKELVGGVVATLFKEWEQQLRDKVEECELLKQTSKTLKDALEVKDDMISRLRNDNARLGNQVAKSEMRSDQDDSPRLRTLIDKHNDLQKEHELLKSTAIKNQRALIRQLRKEREKLKGWNRFSRPGRLQVHLPSVTACRPGQRQLGSVDKWEGRSSFSDGKDHVEGTSQAQGGASPFPSGLGLTGTKDSLSNEKKGLGGLRSTTGTLWKDVEDQPPKATEVDPSLFDARPPGEPETGSPELPSLPEKSQVLFAAGEHLSAEPGTALSLESLPQIQHSGSAAPASEDLTLVQMEELSAPNTPTPEFPGTTGARTVRNSTSVTTGHIPVGSAGEPVTIKSDPDSSFEATQTAQPTTATTPIHESLDPPVLTPNHTSQQKPHPSPPLPSNLPDEVVRSSLANLRSFSSPRATSAAPVSKKSSSLSAQQSIARTTVSSHAAQDPTPLRPIDGNARRGPRNADFLSVSNTRKRKYDDRAGSEAVPTISANSEKYPSRAEKLSEGGTCSPRSPRITKLSSAHQRLDDLLTTPSAPKRNLMSVSQKDIDDMRDHLWAASMLCTSSAKEGFEALLGSEAKDWRWWHEAKQMLESNNMRAPSTPFSHPARIQQGETWRKQPVPAPAPAVTPTATSKPNPRNPYPSAPAPAPAPSSRPPYRTLPLSSLNLTHFKLNPSANHNLTHAYTDVVRNQAERRCLPGCTRSECCGAKFAALAQTLPQTPTSTAAPTVETLLKSYLGPARYSTMPPEQRNHHLLAARTSHLANQYGKSHRAIHPRPPTPPGFWNVDFPETQEREEERRLAEQRERDEVERRWRESMKNADPREKEKEKENNKNRASSEGRTTLRRAPDLAHGDGQVGLWMFADE